jgi:ribose 1,5-bisphosphokinase
MVVVVGPSGAGKDTLMAYAARHFASREDVVFVRRVITRDGAAGGEDHDAVSEETFEMLENTGRFAVSWGAHGLRYGIPAETKAAVDRGQLVVANGSRSALSRFKAVYPSLFVINVTASPDVLAARLAARGRETKAEILRRRLSGDNDRQQRFGRNRRSGDGRSAPRLHAGRKIVRRNLLPAL